MGCRLTYCYCTKLCEGMSDSLPFGIPLGNTLVWGFAEMRKQLKQHSLLSLSLKEFLVAKPRACSAPLVFPVKALSGKVPVLLNKQALPFIREVI